MLNNSVEIIKSQIEMKDICERYGIEVNQRGFVCCPFHVEHTPSMKVYPGERGYHCFGCGESGDVISFVMKFFSVSFKEALRKIDLDFNLNLYGDRTFEERRQAHFKQKAILHKKQREKFEKEKVYAEYWEAFDNWKKITDDIKKYKPKNANEDLNPAFVESLKNLSYQEYLLDLANERRRIYA